MNSTDLATSSDLTEKCLASIYQFQITTGALLGIILSLLLDAVGIVAAIPANVLVILAFSLNRTLRHNSDVVLVILACSDLLVSGLLQPLLMAKKIEVLLRRPSCTTATAFLVALPIVGNACILSQTMVSLERSLAVLAPYRYKEWVTPSRLYVLPACFWFVWTVCFLTLTWVFSFTFAQLVLGGSVALCLLVTAVCYGLLVRVAKHQENQISLQQLQLSGEERKKIKRERKALWNAIYIISAYCLAHLPVVFAFLFIANVNPSEQNAFLLRSWAGTLCFSLATANPLILSWRNSRIGQQMKKLVGIGPHGGRDEARIQAAQTTNN